MLRSEASSHSAGGMTASQPAWGNIPSLSSIQVDYNSHSHLSCASGHTPGLGSHLDSFFSSLLMSWLQGCSF